MSSSKKLKVLYRTKKTISIFSTQSISLTWEDVKSMTVFNSFKKFGFNENTTNPQHEEQPGIDISKSEEKSIKAWNKFASQFVVSSESFNDFMNVGCQLAADPV